MQLLHTAEQYATRSQVDLQAQVIRDTIQHEQESDRLALMREHNRLRMEHEERNRLFMQQQCGRISIQEEQEASARLHRDHHRYLRLRTGPGRIIQQDLE